jgi:triosephosphate isomerase
MHCGVTGSLISHSEDRRPVDEIKKCVDICRKHGLTSIVCAESVEKVKEVSAFKPDFVAIEPPELIGSGIPVSKADPGIVTRSVAAVTDPAVKVLCGAGISKGEDVKAALELGTVGVLLASGVVKAKDPKAALKDLVTY